MHHSDNDPTNQQDASQSSVIPGSNVTLWKADDALLSYRMLLKAGAPESMIVWTTSEDSVVFWKFVLPLAQAIGVDKSVVILDQDAVNFSIDAKTQFALVVLDAEKMTSEFLKKLVRGEGPLSSLLTSQTTHSLFYLHSTHRCREAIHPLVLLLVDTDHYQQQRPRAHVIVSGVYGSPNSSKAVTPNVVGRTTSVFGIV